LDASASAAVVLTATGAFILTALLAPEKGIVSQWRIKAESERELADRRRGF
jgi:hypothetical protein